MEATKPVSQKYSKELEEISQQIELVKAGKSSYIELICQIESLTICAYYDGKCDGMQEMHEILRN